MEIILTNVQVWSKRSSSLKDISHYLLLEEKRVKRKVRKQRKIRKGKTK